MEFVFILARTYYKKMNQEYTTSTGYKIFYGLLAMFMSGFSIFLFKTYNPSVNAAILLMPVLVLVGAVLIVINLIKRKVTISDYSIARTNVWNTKEIIIKDIKGFRVGDKAIFIYPVDESGTKLTISDYTSIADDKELIGWLRDNFKDLNKVEFEEEKQEILQDTALGATEQEREQKFTVNRKYTMWYSMAGIVSFTVTVLLHTDNHILAIALLIYPLIGIAMMAYSKGLIRLFAKKNSAYVSIAMGILFPALALLVQSIMNAKLLDYDKLWLPAGIMALIVFMVLYFVIVKSVNDKILPQLPFALIIAAVYSVGAVSEINCGFDQSEAKIYPVMVIDHYVTHGKSTSYHITISEWRPDHSSENVSVSESFYDNTPVGSKVNVNVKQGALHIPWYYVTE